MCGGHTAKRTFRMPFAGSSPRVRGTPAKLRQIEVLDRIIPACAGDTPLCASYLLQQADHPRVCGGHLIDATSRPLKCGSSPRVRGTPQNAVLKNQAERIIPACAGDTSLPSALRPRRPDHPRVCGGHSRQPYWHNWRPGSSPRVRGTQRSNE